MLKSCHLLQVSNVITPGPIKGKWFHYQGQMDFLFHCFKLCYYLVYFLFGLCILKYTWFTTCFPLEILNLFKHIPKFSLSFNPNSWFIESSFLFFHRDISSETVFLSMTYQLGCHLRVRNTMSLIPHISLSGIIPLSCHHTAVNVSMSEKRGLYSGVQ